MHCALEVGDFLCRACPLCLNQPIVPTIDSDFFSEAEFKGHSFWEVCLRPQLLSKADEDRGANLPITAFQGRLATGEWKLGFKHRVS